MRVVRNGVAMAAIALLCACGGEGAPPTGGPAPTPTPTTATLPVTLSSASTDIVLQEGESKSFDFTATYSGTSSSAIVADVQIAGKKIELAGGLTASGTNFTVPLRTIPFLPGGASSSEVTFRLCTTSACSTVYPGSTKTFTVNVDMQLKDWATFQRTAEHTGYVAVRYDTTDFATGWSMPTTNGSPTEIAARRGAVFVNVGQWSSPLQTRALNGTTGASLWSYDLGNMSYFSGPSYFENRVASMAMDLSSGSVPLQIIDASNGRAVGTLSYASQFSPGGVPTPFGRNLYLQAGYFGNVVYANDALAQTRTWQRDTTQPSEGYVHQGQSVAVDADSVYYFGGGNLFALSRATGDITHKIRNPYFTKFGLSYSGDYRGAPMIAPGGLIVTFTDNRQPATPFPLMAFSLSSSTPIWRTSGSYIGHPGIRENILFAIRASGTVIDRIDSSDGAVIGSIDFGSGRSGLISNVIVTGSHLFVASDAATYAVDLRQADYPVVWSAPKGGALAITPDNFLTISARDGLFAYRLAN